METAQKIDETKPKERTKTEKWIMVIGTTLIIYAILYYVNKD